MISRKILSLMTILSLVVSFAPPIALAADGVNTAVTGASVTNVLPVSSAVDITLAAIDLTEADHTHVAVTATVTDNNGCEDITGVTAKLFRTDLTSACTAPDLNNCLTPVAMTVVPLSCTAGGGDLSADYTASIEVQYYADATDAGAYSATTWSVNVIPSDTIGAGTAGTDDTAEMNTLTALNVSTPITYGALALGAITADTTAFDTTVTNTGNKATIGAQVKSGAATALACTIGTIPVGNEKYDAVSTTAYASKTALTAGDITVADVSAAKGAAGNTDTVGWGLQMPATGVSGTCAGTVVFTAI
jgi:hypothetical protein